MNGRLLISNGRRHRKEDEECRTQERVVGFDSWFHAVLKLICSTRSPREGCVGTCADISNQSDADVDRPAALPVFFRRRGVPSGCLPKSTGMT